MKLLPPIGPERDRFSALCLGLAFAAFALGLICSIYPGQELYYFGFSACLFVFVILISREGARTCATILLVLSLLGAVYGYWHGVQYEKWLAEHPELVSKFKQPL